MDPAFEFDLIRADDRRKAEALVVVLHGLGDNRKGKGIAATARAFAESIPGSVVVVPDGPLQNRLSEKSLAEIREHMPDFDPSRSKSWCEMEPLLPLRIAFNRLQAVHDLNSFIDKQLEQYGLDDSRLVLFGFSQGGGMALYSAIKRARPCAAVIVHSAPFFGLTGATSRPPVLMLIGDGDIERIDKIKERAAAAGPIKSLLMKWQVSLFSHRKALERLESRNIPFENRVIPNLGHTVSEETRSIATAFARQKLGLS